MGEVYVRRKGLAGVRSYRQSAMITYMGAKLEIDERLLSVAEEVAVRRGQSLSAFVEQALRDALPPPRSGPGKRKRVDLPTFRGRGLRPGVNLDDSAALLELMESSDAPG
jgi:hypothetical protein